MATNFGWTVSKGKFINFQTQSFKPKPFEFMRAREHRAVRHFLLFAFVAVLLEIIQILDRQIIQLVIYLSVSESAEIFIFS